MDAVQVKDALQGRGSGMHRVAEDDEVDDTNKRERDSPKKLLLLMLLLLLLLLPLPPPLLSTTTTAEGISHLPLSSPPTPPSPSNPTKASAFKYNATPPASSASLVMLTATSAANGGSQGRAAARRSDAADSTGDADDRDMHMLSWRRNVPHAPAFAHGGCSPSRPFNRSMKRRVSL